MLPVRVLGLPSSIEIAKRPDKKLRQGFTGGPAAAAGSKNKQPVPLIASEEGRAGSLYGVR